MKEKMATLGSLVAGITHELNTPLGVVSSARDLVERAVARIESRVAGDEVSEKSLAGLKENLAQAREACNRIGKLVQSLKTFSHIDGAEFQNTNLHDGLDSTIALLGAELPQTTTVVRNYGDIPHVFCSPGQINQVFISLLRNALQALDGPGRVTVSTAIVDDSVKVTIADTERGIPAEKLEHIFEPSFSQRQGRVKLVMNLSCAYAIMQQHDGDILCQSVLGEGSRFTVVVPIAPRH